METVKKQIEIENDIENYADSNYVKSYYYTMSLGVNSSNLDKAEMDRTLVSIDSEIKRRQQVFNEARDILGESTIDIYKYQRFYKEGKLSNLISVDVKNIFIRNFICCIYT